MLVTLCWILGYRMQELRAVVSGFQCSSSLRGKCIIIYTLICSLCREHWNGCQDVYPIEILIYRCMFIS